MTVDAPPGAQKVVCIDFDGTICPWGPLFELSDPFPGAVEAVQRLAKAGFRIYILTSRMSATWWEADFRRYGFTNMIDFGRANHEVVCEYLERFEIPWDEVSAEKVPARAYFDDLAVFAGRGSLAEAVSWWLRADEQRVAA